MAWRNDKTSVGTDLVWDGVETGIAPAPTKGTANIQNANIATETGEAMVSFARLLQQGTGTQPSITNGTLTASVSDGTELLAASTTIKAGYWINISSSTISLTPSLTAQYMVVAGGGGGGSTTAANKKAGGGGGGGGVLVGTSSVSAGAYTITVGGGGAGGSAGGQGTSGSNSSFDVIAVATGGGGGGGSSTPAGLNGGSGGGAGADNSSATSGGTGSQGSNGGNTSAGNDAAAGGGGYSTAGENSTELVGGGGGNGLTYTISGASVVYAGGGGAGGATGGAGGSGGGGNGGADSNGLAATVNTGGGGGGGGNSAGTSVARTGGAGGSGIIVIRYLTGSFTATGGTITTSGSYTVHTFTSNGTFTVIAPTLSGNYFVSYQDTNGKIKLSKFYDPLATDVIVHGTSGTATFSTVNPLKVAAPVAKATEKYQDSNSNEYRYYILDSNGYVWVYDTGAYKNSLANSGVATLWMIPDVTNYSTDLPTGIAVLNGWLCGVCTSTIKAKSTSRLGDAFATMTSVTLMNKSTSNATVPHFAYVGHQGKMYYTDGIYIGEIFPTTSLATSIANVQSYGSWTTQSSTQLKMVTIAAGSSPIAFSGDITRIPVTFFTEEGGTLPVLLVAETVYWLEAVDIANGYFSVFTASTGGSALTISGGTGTQYLNTFYPFGQASFAGAEPLMTFTNQRLNLPIFETATCMVEVGNTVIIGGVTNTLYPWNQQDAVPSDFIALPEGNVKTMINVNNMAYIFAGNKGNVYITNNSVASLVFKVPDYCAGIAGTPASYIEPYFTWGDAEYIRGRVYFSILDQTATKTGNCGGVWSFIPSQNVDTLQDVGIALRLENQNSYGSYNGLATIILGNQEQNAIAPQYWSGWQNSYTVATSSAFGIDVTDTIPATTTIIETDIANTGTILTNTTYSQVEYKMSTPLATGDSVQIYYRLNATDAWTSCGAVKEETTERISGYFSANFENTQWLQLRSVLTSVGNATSSFCRLKELRVR